MVENIQAQNIELYQLQEKFGLQRTNDDQFFPEWQENLPELSDEEKQALDEVKKDYFHLSTYPILEPIIKMVVLSPLLKLAGFYRPPFYLSAEKEVEITSEDQETIVKGRLDLLIFTPHFWIMVIESKRAKYSLEAGIPQTLAYMLGNQDNTKPTFGFVTNGNEFSFLKLIQQDKPIYSQSYPFALNRQDDIYVVLQILKRLAQIVVSF
ncbi:MAG: restriction endonuclease subunit R [Microcoleaceae cyanobacterium MO_207.B10]|nr:restriction endonuclease subunit R [Microcoleaceae cyanobacterium MO_207.B10]